jgi:hypothetical protein
MTLNQLPIAPERISPLSEEDQQQYSNFFQGIVRWMVEKNGTRRLAPFFYLDGLSLNAIYTASTAIVRKLIERPDLHPMEIWPGRCLVIFGAYEFYKTDGEPFNEMPITFLVTHPRRQIFLFPLLQAMTSKVFPGYSWDLPVSNEYCRAGGVDIWGAPKYIADIHIKKSKEWVEFTLSEAGYEVLKFKGRVLPTGQGKPVRAITYWPGYGGYLKANVVANPIEFAQSLNRNSCEICIGENSRLGETLQKMKLSKFPLLYQYSPRIEQILYPPRNPGDM